MLLIAYMEYRAFCEAGDGFYWSYAEWLRDANPAWLVPGFWTQFHRECDE